MDIDGLLAAEAAGAGDDTVPFRASRRHLHRTWAGTFGSLPELYIQPESQAEVEKVVGLARRWRRRIVVTGCAHSPSDLTCSSSWMVNLDGLQRVLAVDAASGVVTFQSGIRLFQLCDALEAHGLAMPNLGSINQQSVAGAIATGTHGSSLRHGLLSADVLALRITLASGRTEFCSPAVRPDLFRAALLSVGALGIITEISFRAVPAFSLRWRQTIDCDAALLEAWPHRLWTEAEFVRVWWFPYSRRAVVWRADKTSDPPDDRPPSSYYDRWLGYYLYHNLLYLAHLAPRILPWVEWFVFGMQYGFRNGTSTGAVQPSRDALLMNCLYSQFVNEWAIPLHKGPEALRRLGSWLNRLPADHPDYVPHGIPFSAEGLYVHAPLEVRVSDTSKSPGPRPFLDPTVEDGPTLYLNATLYRPYGRDPPCRARYYQAFEWLMIDLGGRPHWAKNFNVSGPQLEAMYQNRLQDFRHLRHLLDPDGMFVGPWHRRYILSPGPQLPLEEVEVARHPSDGGGLTVVGHVG